MTFFQAIILGLVQGLTEFLPISSTAHLTLAGNLMGLIDPANPEHWTAFIAVIQLGTLIAVLLYFSRDILSMIRDLISDVARRGKSNNFQWSGNSKLALMIVVGTIPVVVVGLLFKHVIEGALTKKVPVIATSMIVLAVVLFIAERVGSRKRELNATTWLDGLWIGIGQCFALIPGSSRSGTTITAGLFLGMTREAAARFSFLLSIPAVLASGLLELWQMRHFISELGAANLVVATVVSGITGFLSIAFLLKYLRTHSTYVFIGYRLLLGGILWWLVIAGIL